MTHFYAIRPLEPLMFRGNRSFGAAGEHGECQVPPWPSSFAGAFRAAMLGRDAKVLAAFVPRRKGNGSNESEWNHPQGRLGEVLGTPVNPGSFQLAWASLAIHTGGGWKPAIPLPADLVVSEQDTRQKETNQSEARFLTPGKPPVGVRTSYTLPVLPILRQDQQEKPSGRCWLAGDGLTRYLRGETPATIKTEGLYYREVRVGIALNPGSLTAQEGAIYSTEAISFCPEAGFLAGIDGMDEAPDELLRSKGLLRLGGDGRAAEYERVSGCFLPEPPLADIQRSGRFRLILTSPGIFTKGWLPPGVDKEGTDLRLHINGLSAKLCCAAIPHHTVISGWDIANWAPKPAERAVPAGSIFWFDEMKGDPDKLATWVTNGIWGDNPDRSRQAEGFNRGLLAAWHQES